MNTILFVFGLSFASIAVAQETQNDVKLLSDDQAKSCTALGVVSHSKMAIWSVDKATQALLEEALKKAKKKGANGAVLMPLTSNRNLYTMMLQIYRCATN